MVAHLPNAGLGDLSVCFKKAERLRVAMRTTTCRGRRGLLLRRPIELLNMGVLIGLTATLEGSRIDNDHARIERPTTQVAFAWGVEAA